VGSPFDAALDSFQRVPLPDVQGRKLNFSSKGNMKNSLFGLSQPRNAYFEPAREGHLVLSQLFD
jgi:hypothetical protein